MKHILFLRHAVCITDQSFMVDLFMTCTIELMWIDTSILCFYFSAYLIFVMMMMKL